MNMFKAKQPIYYLNRIWAIVSSELDLEPFLINSTSCLKGSTRFKFSKQENFFNNLLIRVQEYAQITSIAEIINKSVRNEFLGLKDLFYFEKHPEKEEQEYSILLIECAINEIGSNSDAKLDSFFKKINTILVKSDKIYIKDIGIINELNASFMSETKKDLFPLLDDRFKLIKILLRDAIQAYQHEEFDKCVVNLDMAFGNTIKSICDIRHYPYLAENCSLNILLDLLLFNKFLKHEDYIFVSSLKEMSSNAGREEYKASQITAKLALDLTFSYITFLVYKNIEFEDNLPRTVKNSPL